MATMFSQLVNWRHVAWAALAALILTCASVMPSVAGERALWQALKSGDAFAIMRHALAPGTGDPANFEIGDCATQRNLSHAGRAQARRAGALFRENGVASAEIFSSQWCRCRETARLLDLGGPQDLAAMNSFYEAVERREAQTAELKRWLQALSSTAPLVLVTHQVNISALTGRFTRSGEILFVKPTADGAYDVLGSVVP
ncbi:MAG: histidine phosphatase family protein [Pseudomonadota bacterium]